MPEDASLNSDLGPSPVEDVVVVKNGIVREEARRVIAEPASQEEGERVFWAFWSPQA
jgi:hypothetical protein